MDGGLFERLRASAADDWRAYTGHVFVRRLADASLAPAAFRHYLAQDYLFLIHYARAYGLAIYKSDTLEDMRQAAGVAAALLDVEMSLHVRYCAGWGLSEADMASVPPDPAMLAYTSYVLERGMAGDLLDLLVGLAPCFAGYAEIGRALLVDRATRLDGNPYRDWIEMYGGAEFQDAARTALVQLERVGRTRGGTQRFDALARTFAAATRLEVGFWEMGLAAAERPAMEHRA